MKRTSFIHELICRFEEEVGSFQIDSVIEEAVFTVYVDGEVFRDMTCSPWDVEELVVGNPFTSGRVDAIEQIDSVEVDAEAGEVRVVLSEDGGSEGRASGAVVDRVLCPQVDARAEVAPMLTAREVSARIGFLEGNSDLFHRTGGVHSAVMVDARADLVAWFEDIGRHNALDKLIGWCDEQSRRLRQDSPVLGTGAARDHRASHSRGFPHCHFARCAYESFHSARLRSWRDAYWFCQGWQV